MKVSTYLQIKDILLYTTRRIYNGKLEAFYNGEWIDEIKFQDLYKLPTILNGCKQNPDKRKLFLLD